MKEKFLSLVWDAQQTSQDESASDGPVCIWTGTYITQQDLEVWSFWQTCKKTSSYSIYIFMEIIGISMKSRQQPPTPTNNQNLIPFLIINRQYIVKNKIGGRSQFFRNVLIKMYVCTNTHMYFIAVLSLFMMNMKFERWNFDFYSYYSLYKKKATWYIWEI